MTNKYPSDNYNKFCLAQDIHNALMGAALPTFYSLVTVGTISPVISEIEACDFATEQDQYWNNVSSFEGLDYDI